VFEDVRGCPVVGEPTLESVCVPKMRGRGGVEYLERHTKDCGDPLAEAHVPVEAKGELGGRIPGEFEERGRAMVSEPALNAHEHVELAHAAARLTFGEKLWIALAKPTRGLQAPC
jgi:hypothetical protein